MHICNVVAARPNFMKVAPIVEELDQRGIDQVLVHTGQHYDHNMSDVFFEQLGIPRPDVYLGVGSGSHSEQTARVMVGFEEFCRREAPDLVVVAGDVNSTLAAALVAAKLHIPVAHVEAGLRSFDRRMPEEVNRVLTDHLSDLLFTTEPSGVDNLMQEGIDDERIYPVGNCMVDTLRKHVDKAVQQAPWKQFALQPEEYALATLHRPANVDHEATLRRLAEVMSQVARYIPIVFAVHPRTRQRLQAYDVSLGDDVILTDPLPYLSFLGLMARARMVLTDSGGIQEETTVLGVPCLTIRPNTERPVTIEQGTNRLVGTDPAAILDGVNEVLNGTSNEANVPEGWDGQAASRIVDVLEAWKGTR
jgi:UDP-N-acetylglucosamine 2-epimerase (non-hydrolysing)